MPICFCCKCRFCGNVSEETPEEEAFQALLVQTISGRAFRTILELCSCVFISKNCFLCKCYPTHHSVDSLNTKELSCRRLVWRFRTTNNPKHLPAGHRASGRRPAGSIKHIWYRRPSSCGHLLDAQRPADATIFGTHITDAPRRPTMTGRLSEFLPLRQTFMSQRLKHQSFYCVSYSEVCPTKSIWEQDASEMVHPTQVKHTIS